MTLKKKRANRYLILCLFLISLKYLICEQVESFNKYFEKIKDIALQTKNLEIASLREINIDFYNNLIFLDPKGCQVLVFDQEGKFLKKIGRKGQGPGEFILPTTACISQQGNIILSDARLRRINKYDKNGNFIFSFIISAHHWQPQIICIDSEDNIFLAGLTLPYEKNNRRDWINKYDSKGKYVKSFLAYNTDQEWVASMYPAFGFDMDEKDTIYAVQINKYEISIYDSEGRLLRTLGKPPKYFKEPDHKLKLDYSRFKNQSQLKDELIRLSKSWTRILRIDVVENKYILLILTANNLVKGCNKEYIMDIWNKEGDLIAETIQTSYKYLCSDKKGYWYFLIYTDEEEALYKDPEYRIGKFKFKKSQK